MANIDLLDLDFSDNDTFELSNGELTTSHNLKIGEKFKFAKNLKNNDFLNRESVSIDESLKFQIEYYVYQLFENNEKLTFKYFAKESLCIHKPLTLVLGLPRPRMLRKILELAAVLPIKAIHLVVSDLSDKSFLLSHATNDDEICQQIRTGVKQSGFPFFPQIKFVKESRQFFDEVFPSLAGYHVLGDSMPEFLNSSAANLLVGENKEINDNGIVVFIGPERGWSKRERTLIVNQGAKLVSLGAEIYQVDTAVVAICSQLKMVYDMNLEKDNS